MNFSYYLIIFLSFIIYQSHAQKVSTHKVKTGESIYSISKKYGISQDEIIEWNPQLKKAILKINSFVIIKSKNDIKEDTKIEESENNDFLNKSNEIGFNLTHIVQHKETLYSIAKKYGITVAKLYDLNNFIKNKKLKSGMKLQVPKVGKVLINDSIGNYEYTNNEFETDVLYQVLPKETLYSISNKTGISIDVLLSLNPKARSGIKVNEFLVLKKGIGIKREAVNNEVVVEKDNNKVEPLTSENLSKADLLIAKASEHFGARYKRGGTSALGFDCSGLMLHTFKFIGIDLPRSSYEMALKGERIGKEKAQKGDLIFFATFGGSRISHVGMITEVLEDEIKFIHSSSSSGVMVSSTKERYYSRSFVQINRILK